MSGLFLVVDTRSVETTIRMGQNMQMCHSLRCKQIDMSTADQFISIRQRQITLFFERVRQHMRV